MSAPSIHGKYRSVPASKLLEALATSLSAIKDEDGLTDADLGAELGKHEDTAAKYRTALADMPATVLLRGISRWDGRFINRALALVGGKFVALESSEMSDRQGVTALMRAVLSLQEALEDDDIVDDAELAERRTLVEAAGQVIDRYRERLRPRAVG